MASYHPNHYNRYSKSSYRTTRRNVPRPFVEDRDAAFFLGKLNKHHDREHVYNQLKKLTRELSFYITKFDMPNGPNGRGNQGFAFVHTKSKEQARSIIARKHLRLGNQECEVKCYDGRTDVESNSVSGRGTPDSGVRVIDNFRPNFTNNPLKPNLFHDTRSRVNSGMRCDSEKFSTRNTSESESHEEQSKIPLELSNDNSLRVEQNNIIAQTNEIIPQIKYEPTSLPVQTTSCIADLDLHDQWLEEQTSYVMNTVNDSNFSNFKYQCEYYLSMLMNINAFDSRPIEQIRALQNGELTYQAV